MYLLSQQGVPQLVTAGVLVGLRVTNIAAVRWPNGSLLAPVATGRPQLEPHRVQHSEEQRETEPQDPGEVPHRSLHSVRRLLLLPIVLIYTSWVFYVLRGTITLEHVRKKLTSY